MQPLTDLTICEGDIAQLEVRFSQENVEGTWMKNGQAISASDRIHIVIDKLVHKLLVENVSREDTGVYSFVVPAQDISTSGKLTVQSKQHCIFHNITLILLNCLTVNDMLFNFIPTLCISQPSIFWYHSVMSHQLREPRLLWRLRSPLQMSAP